MLLCFNTHLLFKYAPKKSGWFKIHAHCVKYPAFEVIVTSHMSFFKIPPTPPNTMTSLWAMGKIKSNTYIILDGQDLPSTYSLNHFWYTPLTWSLWRKRSGLIILALPKIWGEWACTNFFPEGQRGIDTKWLHFCVVYLNIPLILMTRNYNNKRFGMVTTQFKKKYGSPVIHLCEDKKLKW